MELKNMEKKKKVVFRDAGRDKVAIGHVSFLNGFVKVTDDSGSSIIINKEAVVFIKDRKWSNGGN